MSWREYGRTAEGHSKEANLPMEELPGGAEDHTFGLASIDSAA